MFARSWDLLDSARFLMFPYSTNLVHDDAAIPCPSLPSSLSTPLKCHVSKSDNAKRREQKVILNLPRPPFLLLALLACLL